MSWAKLFIFVGLIATAGAFPADQKPPADPATDYNFLKWWCIPLLDIIPTVLLGPAADFKCLKVIEKRLEEVITSTTNFQTRTLRRNKRDIVSRAVGAAKEGESAWNWFRGNVTKAFEKVKALFSFFF